MTESMRFKVESLIILHLIARREGGQDAERFSVLHKRGKSRRDRGEGISVVSREIAKRARTVLHLTYNLHNARGTRTSSTENPFAGVSLLYLFAA